MSSYTKEKSTCVLHVPMMWLPVADMSSNMSCRRSIKLQCKTLKNLGIKLNFLKNSILFMNFLKVSICSLNFFIFLHRSLMGGGDVVCISWAILQLLGWIWNFFYKMYLYDCGWFWVVHGFWWFLDDIMHPNCRHIILIITCFQFWFWTNEN